MQRIVVLTGAGISAESGIRTFRDSGGLWENYRIEEVATPQAWQNNPTLVLDFYNQRRKQIIAAHPNEGHKALVDLEDKFEVIVITQNIDDLHERAGSANILHLHGEIMKSRSSADPGLIYSVNGDSISEGDLCEKGSQLRPHIVWFGEEVPMMDVAIDTTRHADILIVIGTSLAVYPAAGLLYYAERAKRKFLIDPAAQLPPSINDFEIIRQPAGIGVPLVVKQLLSNE
jgi:NAD-dependent deacetylase